MLLYELCASYCPFLERDDLTKIGKGLRETRSDNSLCSKAPVTNPFLAYPFGAVITLQLLCSEWVLTKLALQLGAPERCFYTEGKHRKAS